MNTVLFKLNFCWGEGNFAVFGNNFFDFLLPRYKTISIVFTYAHRDLIVCIYVLSFRIYKRAVSNKIYFTSFLLLRMVHVCQRVTTVAFQPVNRYRVMRFSPVTLSRRKSIIHTYHSIHSFHILVVKRSKNRTY